jgi:hypothetical protein
MVKVKVLQQQIPAKTEAGVVPPRTENPSLPRKAILLSAEKSPKEAEDAHQKPKYIVPLIPGRWFNIRRK